jgi:hypothetical protein
MDAWDVLRALKAGGNQRCGCQKAADAATGASTCGKRASHRGFLPATC